MDSEMRSSARSVSDGRTTILQYVNVFVPDDSDHLEANPSAVGLGLET